MGGRILFLALTVLAGLSVAAARLVQVQTLSNQPFIEQAYAQRFSPRVVFGHRGPIVDRNGLEFALSVALPTVVVEPPYLKEHWREPAVQALAILVGMSPEAVRAQISQGTYVYLARKVEPWVAEAVRGLGIHGVQTIEEPRRLYPGARTAAPVIGEVDFFDNGKSGLESDHQGILVGSSGQETLERDNRGNEVPAGRRLSQPAVQGGRLELTLDRPLQLEVERLLADQMVRTRARGGIVVVTDVGSGDILAMANLVGAPGRRPQPSTDNMAVVRVQELGSVLKVATIAGALEEGVVAPGTRMNVPDRLQVADALFKDSEPHPPMWWDVSEVLAQSSNVGSILIAQQLGRERVDGYLRRFGLDRATAVAFPGEAAGLVPQVRNWTGSSIGSIPIGQGVAVTALQMLGVYNTLANGGVEVHPRLVRAAVDSSGREQSPTRPQARRVVSTETASAVTSMLVKAVKEGTGTAAAVDGYTVAGKTGTARKPKTQGLGYQEGAYLASFVGFLPAESPRLSAIVILDEPTPYYGGITAAPLFASIARFAASYLEVPAGAPIGPGRGLRAPPAGDPAVARAGAPAGIEPAARTTPTVTHRAETSEPGDGGRARVDPAERAPEGGAPAERAPADAEPEGRVGVAAGRAA
ncbi:MAG: penicillin-binding transpeptidase domain-containing protein [Acidimicrobiales bacterium]